MLYIEVAGCSPEVSGVQSASGLMVADHTGFVELSGSQYDQLTLVKLQVWVLLCILAEMRDKSESTHIKEGEKPRCLRKCSKFS